MDRELVGGIRIEAATAPFEFDRGAGWEHFGLACECGSRSFHLVGWPRTAAGRGGLFWRTFARVWRDVRLGIEPGDGVESPFLFPLFAKCDACSREACLFDDERVSDRLSGALRERPRESLRCRACRQGSVALSVAWSIDVRDRTRAAVEVRVRCLACRRPARVAWADNRPSLQELQLDQLYGRR